MTDHQDLQKELETLFAVLEDATETFNIWQACQQSHGDKETVEMFNSAYPGLFVWVEHALLANSISCLCLLNEKRNDTLNFGALLSRFKESLSDTSYGELESKLAELKPVWVKLAVLRNEIFAHRTNKRSVTDSFNKASISSNEIESYIKAAQFIVRRLGVIRFGITYHFTSGSSATMAKLIQDLRSNNSFKADGFAAA
ncbi:MAG: hypothetical protein WA961_00125 [Rhodanobacter sp.]